MEIDKDGLIIFADGALRGLLALRPEYLIGKLFLSLVETKDQPRADNMLKGLSQKIKRIEDVELTLTGKGTPITFSASVFSLEKSIYISLSLKEKSQLTAELDRRDIVSGLLNKDTFIEEANKQILTAKNDVEMTMIDFPKLKPILDSMTP